MKIFLIFPPSVSVIEPFRSQRQKPPPLMFGFSLGLGYIAAVLEQNGFEVEIMDACMENLSIEAIKERIEKSAPDIVGISMLAVIARTAVAIARVVKEIDSHIPVVVGGPHAAFTYRLLLENYPIDYVVIGEGEETMLELAQALKDGQEVGKIKGLAFRQNQTLTVTPRRPLIAKLDQLPLPARHLVDYDRYLYGPAGVMGSRGCSHCCAFCISARLLGKWRGRSVTNIVDELDFLRNRYPKIKSFSFWDDIFTFNRERTTELCQALLERSLNRYSWECVARIDQVNSELLTLMAKAGCSRIQYGIESGAPNVLERSHKSIDLTVAEKAFELTRKAGIEAVSLFMIGNPGETMETIDMSVRLAKRLKSVNTIWSIAQIYPGTEFERLQPVDNSIEYIYEPEVKKPSAFIHPCVPALLPEGFSREKLKRITAGITRQFIFHHAPPNILKWSKKLILHPYSVMRFLYRIFK